MRITKALPLLLSLAACGATHNRAVDDGATPLGAPPKSLDPTPEPVRPEIVKRAEERAAAGEVPEPAPRVAASDESTEDALRTTGAVAWPRGVDAQAEGLAIAKVGGRDILLTDLVSKWMMRDPDGVRAILDDLVLSRIVAMESAALSIRLPDGAIDDVVRRRVRQLDESARAAGAPDLESFARARLGLEPEALVAELQEEAAIDLLAPRCVRAWMLSQERRAFRIIAVKDQDAADRVQARLDAGDDFADVARELSVDTSKDDGGRMPPIVRGDQPLARTAFAVAPGEITGPIDDGEGLVFMKVEAIPDVLEGEWRDVGARVEGSLEEQDVEDPEFWQWKEAMYRRYEIDITPFLELAGR